jgi:A/G-specific adenine glycosylase
VTAQHRPSKQRIAQALLDWYRAHRRALPWRATRDPYAVWVSEVMLQQTQVSTVLDYYARWMRRFPNIEALAAAEEADVLHVWQGLGYYSRARSLLSGARKVRDEHAGRVPDRVEALLALPGIGPYSAGAIASIAYGQPAPIVDGNVTRLLCRLFGLSGAPSRQPLRSKLWALAEQLIPRGHSGDFNQALMELGALVCTPKQPDCKRCPVAQHCVAHRDDRVHLLPETPRRPPVTRIRMVAAVVLRRGRVLVTRVPDDAARWAGMWQFPNAELAAGETPKRALGRAVRAAIGVGVEAEQLVTSVNHSVTRYRITLDAYQCRLASAGSSPPLREHAAWHLPEQLDALAMPAAHRRLSRTVQRRSA